MFFTIAMMLAVILFFIRIVYLMRRWELLTRLFLNFLPCPVVFFFFFCCNHKVALVFIYTEDILCTSDVSNLIRRHENEAFCEI